MVTSCGTQWYLRLLVQSSTNEAEKKRLTFFHQEVQRLMEILNVVLNLDTATERDVMTSILKANKVINITFDTFTGKVTAITE
jgi:hypothetical protein